MSPILWAYNKTYHRRSCRRRNRVRLKSLTMETLFQFFDNLEDAIVAMALRLRRFLMRRPQERRRVARTPMIKSQDEDPLHADSGHAAAADEDRS